MQAPDLRRYSAPSGNPMVTKCRTLWWYNARESTRDGGIQAQGLINDLVQIG